MTLPNVKELRGILKLCREQGVTDIKLGELEIKFGDLPSEKKEAMVELDGVSSPSQEELLYWSSQPDPLANEAN